MTGEVRSVANIDRRLKEFEQMGFEVCIFPASTQIEFKPKTLQLKPVSHIREMVAFLHSVMQEKALAHFIRLLKNSDFEEAGKVTFIKQD